jgi:hypothetical protein
MLVTNKNPPGSVTRPNTRRKLERLSLNLSWG